MELQVTFRCSTADEVERLGAALREMQEGNAPEPEPEPERPDAKRAEKTEAKKDKTNKQEATVEQLRAAGKALIDAGRRDDLKAILDAHGCRNLAVVAESDRGAVLAELEKALS